MKYKYTPVGVCPQEIEIELQDDVIQSVAFLGGCNGNLKAISKVVQGMNVEQVENLFSDITCGRRPTSCSAQLAKGVREAFEQGAQK